MHRQKSAAIAKRGLYAARCLKVWAKELTEEMRRGNIEFDVQGYYEGTMEVPVQKIARMAEDMLRLANEIQKFKPTERSN